MGNTAKARHRRRRRVDGRGECPSYARARRRARRRFGERTTEERRRQLDAFYREMLGKGQQPRAKATTGEIADAMTRAYLDSGYKLESDDGVIRVFTRNAGEP